MPTVPRDTRSPRGARLRAQAQAYAAHLTRVRRSSWRLGRVGRFWLIARHGPDTDGWLVLDEQLVAFDDIDPVVELARVRGWCGEVLGVRSVALVRDATAGGVAFRVEVAG